MTPTLMGRLQTRIFLVIVVGGLWTLFITPFLPVSGGLVITEYSGSGLTDAYEATYTTLFVFLVLGLVWECIYQGLMQFRWEKDWPAMLQILTVINEGIAVYLVLRYALPEDAKARLVVESDVQAFLVHYVTTFYVVFAFANSFMRVIFIRWRFRYGRLI
jgi:hypothetical protein